MSDRLKVDALIEAGIDLSMGRVLKLKRPKRTVRQLAASLRNLRRQRERERVRAIAQIEGIDRRLWELENGITRP
jgi:hypothetical protein